MSLLNFLCLCTFCTCLAAWDPPIIMIPGQGSIMGKEISRSRVQKIIGYYGIPYAQPPVEKLRFSAPDTDNLVSWEGVRNITDYMPACLQTEKDIREEAKPFLDFFYPSYNDITMDEDCLYLNVFVPYGNRPSGLATIVWIHPGNFTTGSPSMWNPHTLVYRHRIIVVTIAWRLNIMGFFTTGDGEAPGNYGLMDQQAAMMWVKKNIKLFGGNEDNITLMGYGTGGVSVGLHMINPKSREYFHKAIIMSANFLNPSVVKYPKEDERLLETFLKSGCTKKPTSILIECLKNVDAKELVKETSHINWRPLIDVSLSNSTLPFLTELPKAHFERGDFHKVPFLTGYTDMEDILAYSSQIDDMAVNNVSNDNLQQILTDIVNSDIPVINGSESACVYNYDHITDSVMFFYGPSSGRDFKDINCLRQIMANFTTERSYASPTFLHARYVSKEQPTFVYRFDRKPITSWVVENIPEWVSVPHLYDLIYVWGMPYWQEFDDKVWEARDKRMSDIIMSLWTSFAKTSDPTNASSYAIAWESFKEESPQMMIMDGSFNMTNSRKVNYKAFEFWNEYYPKVLQIATQCCNTTEDGSVSIQASCGLLIILILLHYLHII